MMTEQEPNFSSGLPDFKFGDVTRVAGIFNERATTYKFYWFISILDALDPTGQQSEYQMDNLILKMLTYAWFPLKYYRISFPYTDSLEKHIRSISETFDLEFESKEQLFDYLDAQKNHPVIRKILNDLSRYVPFRFLTPWFFHELKGMKDASKTNAIIDLSVRQFFGKNPPLYKFSKDKKSIVIHPDWHLYLSFNRKILLDFINWNLIRFLSNYNENIPQLYQKLFPPVARNLSKARQVWNFFLKDGRRMQCIYSGEWIEPGNFSIDHYLPWKFVTHDKIWNLIPAPGNVNSSKSDCIPSQNYFRSFVNVQHELFKSLYESGKMKGEMEEYMDIFHTDLQSIHQMDESTFLEKFGNTFRPLEQIAANMGYRINWSM